jgi:hypothetical protein
MRFWPCAASVPAQMSSNVGTARGGRSGIVPVVVA